jgi:uncharacterized membrane protein (DUF2068 family)
MKQPKDRLLCVIAIFKFFKAIMLITLGLGAFRLIHRNIAEFLMHWVDAFKLDPGNRFVDAALSKAAHVTPTQIKHLGLGSFVYAALFFTEGMGLWLQKRWGEWLTVIITSSLVPLEIYEIHRHPTALKFAVLGVNIAIVAYLIFHMRRQPSNSK